MKIIELTANWFYTNDGEEYVSYVVGEMGVTKIIEHYPRGEGDRWFYDVRFDNGRTMRIFNPNSVSFEKEQKNEND